MKIKVTLTKSYIFDEEDELTEQQAVEAALEIHGQDSNWNDDQIIVEQIN